MTWTINPVSQVNSPITYLMNTSEKPNPYMKAWFCAGHRVVLL
ncbi:hypothetical protein Sps_01404 [Shewanella psychrophila]|uniref:Uncharacterized protein n=1 Tax=Shewanella psychrophila TaxID=225848 RepID=A0A1S6HM27_9GAMM|nr:hypothetical protein Sps_01404 [Shewanella psychrophila]